MLKIKIGEVARPSVKFIPGVTEWRSKASQEVEPKSVIVDDKTEKWKTDQQIVSEATECAKAWLGHPANKMQLASLQAAYDSDGDGVTSRSEFKKLLAAAGSKADADVLFNQLDADGSGYLTDAEIKDLGQDRTGKATRRGL